MLESEETAWRLGVEATQENKVPTVEEEEEEEVEGEDEKQEQEQIDQKSITSAKNRSKGSSRKNHVK